MGHEPSDDARGGSQPLVLKDEGKTGRRRSDKRVLGSHGDEPLVSLAAEQSKSHHPWNFQPFAMAPPPAWSSSAALLLLALVLAASSPAAQGASRSHPRAFRAISGQFW